MNAVRFYMNDVTFEDAQSPGQWKASGWAWLDDNIAWAKKQSVYLILNLHVPPGGYQSLGKGTGLWESPEAQARFIALWRAIAERYRSEPSIAGYDLLNEPVVTKSIGQWQDLAERTIAAVRNVDPWHIVFVERVNSVGAGWYENAERNFFRVKDPNVVYEFHFYKPFHFTHQSAHWAESAATDTRYPDANVAGIEWFNEDWKASTFQSPHVSVGDSDWKFYSGTPYTVTDPSLVVGKPVLGCSQNSGKVWFDDLILEQLDSNGNSKRTIWTADLHSKRGWFYWTKDGSGTASNESLGHSNKDSVAISGNQSDAALSADYLQFRLEPKGVYRLSGWMRGQAVPAKTACQIRFDLYSAKAPVFPLDKSFLAYEMDAYANWGKRQRVPLFLGEFGAIRQTFEADRGGLRWVNDMLDLIAERQLNFTFHDYHEVYMGLFYGDDTLPDPANSNQPLLELFREKLKALPVAR
jgi:endoglucanase